MNELVTFPVTARAVTITNKNGSVVTRLLSAKEYKANLPESMSSREKTAGFNAYLRAHLAANTGGLAAALTSGKIGISSIQRSKDGSKLVIRAIDMDKLKGAKVDEIQRSLNDLDAGELAGLLETLKNKLAVLALPEAEAV